MRTIKCDGNHGGPPCADPECWARDDVRGSAPPWVTLNLDGNCWSYLNEIVNADIHRMRQLMEHAKSRGERNLSFASLSVATHIAEVLVLAWGIAAAKAVTPLAEEITGLSDEDRSVMSDVLRCLHSNAREAFIDGLASALTIITPDPFTERPSPKNVCHVCKRRPVPVKGQACDDCARRGAEDLAADPSETRE